MKTQKKNAKIKRWRWESNKGTSKGDDLNKIFWRVMSIIDETDVRIIERNPPVTYKVAVMLISLTAEVVGVTAAPIEMEYRAGFRKQRRIADLIFNTHKKICYK